MTKRFRVVETGIESKSYYVFRDNGESPSDIVCICNNLDDAEVIRDQLNNLPAVLDALELLLAMIPDDGSIAYRRAIHKACMAVAEANGEPEPKCCSYCRGESETACTCQ